MIQMKTVKLGDIATIYNGNSINKEVKKEKYMKDVPGWNYIGTKDVEFDGTINYNTGVIIPFSEEGFRLAPAGSVFVCSEGGSAGRKTAIVKNDVCFGNKLFAVVNEKGLFDSKYVYFYTRYEKFREQFKLLATSLMGGISTKNFSMIELPLCDLNEQKSIVGRIEELFSKLDANVKTLDNVKGQIEIYRQAVLKDAFDKALADCRMCQIEQMLSVDRKGMTTGPFGTMIKKQEHQKSGVPMLGIENIGQGKFVDGNKIFVSEEKAEELKSFSLRTGDIIISRSGTVGEICAVPQRAEGALLSTNLMRVSLNPDIIRSDFFIYLFQSKGIVLEQVKELCKGSTRIFLNQTILKQISFPVPNLQIQEKIVNEIEYRLSACKNIEETVNSVLEGIVVLRQSILKEAFEGRL